MALNTTLCEASQAHLGGTKGVLYKAKAEFLCKENCNEASLSVRKQTDEVTGNDEQDLGRPHPAFGTS